MKKNARNENAIDTIVDDPVLSATAFGGLTSIVDLGIANTVWKLTTGALIPPVVNVVAGAALFAVAFASYSILRVSSEGKDRIVIVEREDRRCDDDNVGIPA